MFRKPRKEGREMSVTPAMHSRMAKKVALRARQPCSAPAPCSVRAQARRRLRMRGAPGRLLLNDERAQHGSPDGRCEGQHHRVVQRQQYDCDQVCGSPTVSACRLRAALQAGLRHTQQNRRARARTVHDGAVAKDAADCQQPAPATGTDSQPQPVHTKHRSRRVYRLGVPVAKGVLPVSSAADERKEEEKKAPRQQHLEDRDVQLVCEGKRTRVTWVWLPSCPQSGTPKQLSVGSALSFLVSTSIVLRKHPLRA